MNVCIWTNKLVSYSHYVILGVWHDKLLLVRVTQLKHIHHINSPIRSRTLASTVMCTNAHPHPSYALSVCSHPLEAACSSNIIVPTLPWRSSSSLTITWRHFIIILFHLSYVLLSVWPTHLNLSLTIHAVISNIFYICLTHAGSSVNVVQWYAEHHPFHGCLDFPFYQYVHFYW